MLPVDIRFDLGGITFVWDEAKASLNILKHDVTFEQAATVFLDPLFRIEDASRNDEARDAVLGYSADGKLLFVVHVVIDDEAIRIISARKATHEERYRHEHS